jgi:UDP-glucose 4-epimerase
VTAIVTGGSGFIGSHIVDKLLERGEVVRVIDLVKPQREDVEWHQVDLLNENDVERAVSDAETVYHLAAVADVNKVLVDIRACLRINEEGTLNLLKACTTKEVDRVVLASTTWVYGKSVGTVTEDSHLPPPDNMYTKTKIGQEHLTLAWHDHFGLDYSILRYDIPYGPRMRSNMAVAAFVRRATKKEAITVFGDGGQGRCFIYVEDLAEGSIASSASTGKNQIFNLAGSEFITINDIVVQLKRRFGDLTVEHAPARPGDFRGVRTSIEKAKTVLGWKPKVSFEEGMQRYISSLKLH